MGRGENGSVDRVWKWYEHGCRRDAEKGLRGVDLEVDDCAAGKLLLVQLKRGAEGRKQATQRSIGHVLRQKRNQGVRGEGGQRRIRAEQAT